MPKPKLTDAQKKSLRGEIARSLSAGVKLIDIVEGQSKKFGVVPETIRWYVKKVQSGEKPKRRGRPPGSTNQKRGPGRPPGPGKKRGPGRPPKAVISGELIHGVERAQLVLQVGGRSVTVASLIYGDEGRLIADLRRAVSTLG